MTPDLIATAEEAWGAPLPDWIRSLALPGVKLTP